MKTLASISLAAAFLAIPHDWVDWLNAGSTAVIAVFTVLLFVGVVYQVKTSREIERAWVLTELGWYEGGLHVTETESVDHGETTCATHLNVKLTCRNDGRSPAWIESIFGRVDIFRNAATDIPSDAPAIPSLFRLGDMEPLGPGTQRSRILQMSCEGHANEKQGEFFSVSFCCCTETSLENDEQRAWDTPSSINLISIGRQGRTETPARRLALKRLSTAAKTGGHVI